MAEHDRQKVIVVGASAAGKSCLIERFHYDRFEEKNPSNFTVGVEFCAVTEEQTRPLNVRYTLWDTSGAERYMSLSTSYFRGAHVVLLVYDVTDEWSFDKACTVWRREVLRRATDAQVLLVANKTDLTEQRVVSSQRGKAFAERNGYRYFETSAKSGHNVNMLFWEVATILSKLEENDRLDLSLRTSRVRLRDTSPGLCVAFEESIENQSPMKGPDYVVQYEWLFNVLTHHPEGKEGQ